MRPKLTPEQFWAKTTRQGECLIWLGAVNPKGYGKVYFEGRNRRAHCVAWELTRGPIPDGLWVLHTCDNPRCCNRLHLFLGDNLANNRDKAAKGRHIYGEAHKLAKLTEPDVVAIKQALAAGGVKHRDLAERFGVSPGVIDHIKAGTTWKHVKSA